MNTHCKRGHDLAATAYVRKNGKGRFCIECVNIRRVERLNEAAESGTIKAPAEDASTSTAG